MSLQSTFLINGIKNKLEKRTKLKLIGVSFKVSFPKDIFISSCHTAEKQNAISEQKKATEYSDFADVLLTQAKKQTAFDEIEGFDININFDTKEQKTKVFGIKAGIKTTQTLTELL